MNVRDKSEPIPKMNSTNLYATTTHIIINSDPKNPNSWQDLYRLIPYLRNSLCCVVCSTLLVDPLSPSNAQCQHHVCRICKGGRKKIKPACETCKDCKDYRENRRLRVLLQCYKQMCITLMNLPVFKIIIQQATQPGNGFERGASNLIALIKEGATFQDDYKSNGGIPKSAYSILPCVYTNSTTITTPQQIPPNPSKESRNIFESQIRNRANVYSVVYPGGNKITLKRKPKENPVQVNPVPKVPIPHIRPLTQKSVFKKPSLSLKKKGCRCGNATATPGKLTCCGQRCPCYVDSKPCLECKCRGCRNPHRIDGQKVIPNLLDLQQLISTQSRPQHQLPIQGSEISSISNIEMDSHPQYATAHEHINMNQHYKTYKFVRDYSTTPLTSSTLLPIEFTEDDQEISVV